ncbi:unnamed protein product, partial [Amoebophrya sp. A25]|eukprot:GSA25T00025775001.1
MSALSKWVLLLPTAVRRKRDGFFLRSLLFLHLSYSLTCSFAEALSRDQLQQVACDLQSFIVDEASTKSQILEVLSGWDATSEMQVLVFNGHFATGKTYISNILAKALESIDIGGGSSASAAGGSSSGGGHQLHPHHHRDVNNYAGLYADDMQARYHDRGNGGEGASDGHSRGSDPNYDSSRSTSGGYHGPRGQSPQGGNPYYYNSMPPSGGGSGGSRVAIFVTEDSFISSEQFYVRVDEILRDQDDGRMKIIVFDDLPCWRDTERITRILTRCL